MKVRDSIPGSVVVSGNFRIEMQLFSLFMFYHYLQLIHFRLNYCKRLQIKFWLININSCEIRLSKQDSVLLKIAIPRINGDIWKAFVSCKRFKSRIILFNLCSFLLPLLRTRWFSLGITVLHLSIVEAADLWSQMNDERSAEFVPYSSNTFTEDTNQHLSR